MLPLRSTLFPLLVAFFLFSATHADAGAPSEVGEYVHSGGLCLRCHTDKDELQKVLTASLGSCKGCHEQGRHGGEPLKALSSDVTTPVTPVPPDIGMRFPLYPMTSRLGDAPNEMVRVPAGEFIMGTDERLPDEGPQHRVWLEAFDIDKYEVTNLQYHKFNEATRRRSPTHWRNRTFPGGKADHPVTHVSWKDADAYCRWAGKRLPSEAEWEKAARGSDGRTYPWGNEFDIARANTPLRWSAIGRFGDTTPVGSFEGGVSPYGAYDMSGNVWEWTASWYQPYPGNNTPSESYGTRYKVLKGGSWFDCAFYRCGISAPVFNRAFFASEVKNESFGFRCARDVAAGKKKHVEASP